MEPINKSALAIQLIATVVQCVCWYLIGKSDGKKKAKEKIMLNSKCSLYQARNGKVYIVMGTRYAELSLQQINDLGIDLYSLEDFDLGDYRAAFDGIRSSNEE